MIGIDGNNYFYKFLTTETQCAEQLEQSFCLLSSQVHDTDTLSLIGECLEKCETSSERHLLRSLYIFCLFCYTTLKARRVLFVLDGAAPNVKTSELVERKQQKRAAHGKLLNNRRALLLHRIYVLRWYQFLCLALAFLRAMPLSDNNNNNDDDDDDDYSDQHRSSSAQHRSPCHDALYRLLQNAFEWALGTEIPELLFAEAAENTFLAHLDARAAQFLIGAFAKLRATVQTSFLVELDWLNVCGADDDDIRFAHRADAPAVLSRGDTMGMLPRIVAALIDTMIETDVRLSAQAATSDGQQEQFTSLVRPYLVCLHVGRQQQELVQKLFEQHSDAIERCWRNSHAVFLVCCVVHADVDKDDNAPAAAAVVDDETDKDDSNSESVAKPTFLFPASFAADRRSAEKAFSRWETLSATFWCNENVFAHRHHHVWRPIEYADWLCSVKSNAWLRETVSEQTDDNAEDTGEHQFASTTGTRNNNNYNNSGRTSGGDHMQTDDVAAAERVPIKICKDRRQCYDDEESAQMLSPLDVSTEREKLMYFYCDCVPTSYGEVYNTQDDDSHRNLLWTDQIRALFAKSTSLSEQENACSNCGSSSGSAATTNAQPPDSTTPLLRFIKNFFSVPSDATAAATAAGAVIQQQQSSGKKRTSARQSALSAKRHKKISQLSALPAKVAEKATNTTACSFGTPQHNVRLSSHLEEKNRQRIRFRITDEYLQVVVHFLRRVCGAQVVVAEHEAEASCAKLCRDRVIDYVFSDDVDALAFGAPNIVVDWPSICVIANSLLLLGGTLQPSFSAKIVCVDALLAHFDINRSKFVMWCVLCGSDFVVCNSSNNRNSNSSSSSNNNNNNNAHIKTGSGLGHVSTSHILRVVRRCASVSDCLRELERLTESQSGAGNNNNGSGSSSGSSGGSNVRGNNTRHILNSVDHMRACAAIERAYCFFNDNAYAEQTDFLAHQLPPRSVDETVNLHTICLTRKMAFQTTTEATTAAQQKRPK